MSNTSLLLRQNTIEAFRIFFPPRRLHFLCTQFQVTLYVRRRYPAFASEPWLHQPVLVAV